MRPRKNSSPWDFSYGSDELQWGNIHYQKIPFSPDIFISEQTKSNKNEFQNSKSTYRSHARGDDILVANHKAGAVRNWKGLRFGEKANYQTFKEALKPDVLPDIFPDRAIPLYLEWNDSEPSEDRAVDSFVNCSSFVRGRGKSKVPIKIGSSLSRKSDVTMSGDCSTKSIASTTDSRGDSSEYDGGSDFCLSDSDMSKKSTEVTRVPVISSEPPPQTLRGILKKSPVVKTQRSDETDLSSRTNQKAKFQRLVKTQKRPNQTIAVNRKQPRNRVQPRIQLTRRTTKDSSKSSLDTVNKSSTNPKIQKEDTRKKPTGLFVDTKSLIEKEPSSKLKLRKGLFHDFLAKTVNDDDIPTACGDSQINDTGRQQLSFKNPLSIHFLNERNKQESNVLFYSEKSLRQHTDLKVQSHNQALQKIAKQAKTYKMAGLRGVFNLKSLANKNPQHSQRGLPFRRHFHKCYNVLHLPKLDVHSALKRSDVFAKEKKKVEHLVSPKFLRMFRIFASGANSYNCGIAISKIKSYIWQEAAGLYNGMLDPEYAAETFVLHCGIKCVMNVYDYMYYLVRMVRQKGISIVTLLDMMNNCFFPVPERFKRKARSMPPRIQKKPPNQVNHRARSQPPPWRS